jgi:glycosyltransferase involved in cell wall biosynthesis
MPEIYDRDRTPELDLTVLLPSFNEEDAIGPVIREIREALKDWRGSYEILVVDDASTDQTAERAVAENVRVLRRPENGGSGASRKTGTRAARGRVVAMLDADGTYVAADLPHLLSFFPDYDQVNGARTSEKGTMRALRFGAKLMIRKLAEFISGKRIPDLNTGMKLYKRDLMLQYLWCMPDGFSCVTSMTLAFLCNGHPVKYVAVEYRKRIGKSKFHPIKDAAKYFATMVRIIMYFRPLRVFWPATLLAFVLGVVGMCYHSYNRGPLHVSTGDVVFFAGSVSLLVIGLLADLIVAQRRHLPTELFQAYELRESMPNFGARESMPNSTPVRQAS